MHKLNKFNYISYMFVLLNCCNLENPSLTSDPDFRFDHCVAIFSSAERKVPPQLSRTAQFPPHVCLFDAPPAAVIPRARTWPVASFVRLFRLLLGASRGRKQSRQFEAQLRLCARQQLRAPPIRTVLPYTGWGGCCCRRLQAALGCPELGYTVTLLQSYGFYLKSLFVSSMFDDVAFKRAVFLFVAQIFPNEPSVFRATFQTQRAMNGMILWNLWRSGFVINVSRGVRCCRCRCMELEHIFVKLLLRQTTRTWTNCFCVNATSVLLLWYCGSWERKETRLKKLNASFANC